MMKTAPLAGKKILVVDDEADLREIICEDFQRLGADVDNAENGHSGFELAKAMNPDAIVSDIRMPGGDGIDLLKKVRGFAFLRPPKVFLITGFADVTLEEAMRLGAQGMLSKPFNLKQLRELLIQHLSE